MDTTNLYLPHELRMSSKGICEQTHSIEVFIESFSYTIPFSSTKWYPKWKPEKIGIRLSHKLKFGT